MASETKFGTTDGTWFLLGDAVTQTAGRRGGYLARLRDAVASIYPDRRLELVAAGRAGDRVPDLRDRLFAEVLPRDPAGVVVVVGVTDVWYASRGQATPIDEYRAALADIVRGCRERRVPVWLCTPMVVGERIGVSNSFDEGLDLCADAVRQVAAAEGAGVVDLRRRFRDELARINDRDRAHGLLTVDGVHPNDAGSRLIESAIREALGMDVTRGGERVLRHIVLFRWVPQVDAAELASIERQFRQLAREIPGVLGFVCGTDNSPEGLQQGFTHAYIVTFRDEAARDAYLPHPAHQAFVDRVKPRLAQALVVDFWGDADRKG